MLPVKLGGFLPQLGIEIKSQETSTSETESLFKAKQ